MSTFTTHYEYVLLNVCVCAHWSLVKYNFNLDFFGNEGLFDFDCCKKGAVCETIKKYVRKKRLTKFVALSGSSGGCSVNISSCHPTDKNSIYDSHSD